MLIARAFNAFTTRLYRPGGAQIGEPTIATWLGAPRNARLSAGKDDVARIELGGTIYRLEWEVLRDPAGRRGVRWFLVDGEHTLATATARSTGRRSRWELDASGERYALVMRSRWFTRRCDLLKGDDRVGGVHETTRMFSLARTYEVACPAALGEPVQAFLVHLVTGTTR